LCERTVFGAPLQIWHSLTGIPNAAGTLRLASKPKTPLHVAFAIVLAFNDEQGRNSRNLTRTARRVHVVGHRKRRRFHDEGLDDVRRKTELRCWPPPSCRETKRVTYAFEFGPCEKHTQVQRFARGAFSCRIECRRPRPARKTEAQKSRLNRARRHATLAG
jgi:hypothetical protein